MPNELKQRLNSYVSAVDVSFALRIGVLLLVFLIAERGLKQLAQLPSESYQEASILLALVKHSGGAVLMIILAVGILVWRVPSVRASWLVLPQGRLVRVIATACAGILAWTYSTYATNLYFNQSHVDGRLALVLFAVLTWWRPLFVPAFLLVVVAVLNQFHFPLGGYSVAEQFLLVQVLLMCWLGFCLHALWPDTGKGETTLFLVFILIATGYWTCGFGKLRLNWISFGHLHHLLHATYANGWLGFLSAEQIAKISGWAAKFDWPMRVMVLTFEVGALAFLWRRWTMMVLLTGWVLFHLGVLLMSGIFFWKWILLELVILVFLIRNRETTQFTFFKPSLFLLSVMLIGAGKWVFRPVNLSWFDSPVSYTFRFEAETVDGRRYSLPPGFFSPYSKRFTIGAFRYLSEEPMIPVVWGAVFERNLAERLLTMKSLEDVHAVERELNDVTYDPAGAAGLEAFVRRFVQNLEERGYAKNSLRYLRPPPQLLTFAGEDAYEGSSQIVKVRVVVVTALFDGREHLELERKVNREIVIRP